MSISSGKNGTNPLDGVTHKIYPLVERYRKELAVNGNIARTAGPCWKTYALISVCPSRRSTRSDSASVSSTALRPATKAATFYATEFALTPIPARRGRPEGRQDRASGPCRRGKSLDPAGRPLVLRSRNGNDQEKPATLTITAKNAHRLYYMDSQLYQSLRREHDRLAAQGLSWTSTGQIVEQDRFVPDNVVIEFADDKR